MQNYIHVYSCIPDQIILVTTKILYIECIISKQVERKNGGRKKEKIKNVNPKDGKKEMRIRKKLGRNQIHN